jgi:anaerobic selenocysteine-containing dehydrogenase
MQTRQMRDLSRHWMEQPTTSRRGFLRRAGITGAVTAGLIGVSEVAGLSPASAQGSGSVQRFKVSEGGIQLLRPGESPNCCSCGNYVYCQCGGCCPSGTCCYHVSGCCGTVRLCLPRPSRGCTGSTGCLCC